MPQFNLYPLITDPASADLLLIYQDSTGAVKTTTVDNLADAIGDILGSTAGAPSTAKYILQQPHVDLSSAQSLSELSTGILKSTTVTGAISIATPGSDYVAPGVITSSGLTSITGVLLGRTTAGTGAVEALTTIPTAVQDQITRLGTIVAGVWNGTAIDIATYASGNLSVSHLDGGAGADSTTFWRGDGTWATPAAGGGGDVSSNTATSVDSEIALFSGTSGKLIKRASGNGIAFLTLGVLSAVATLTAASGGTGQSSYAIGDILYASGATALSKLAGVAVGNAIISGGVATAPSWGKIGLTTHVSGVLPAANGGTGISSYAVGDIIYASGATAISALAGVATGNALISGGVTTAPSWGKINLGLHMAGTVNSVSPTAPNRTIEVVLGGTTYYIAAKTTND